MDFDKVIGGAVAGMPVIGLEDTDKVRLMNRTDTKYLANQNLLLKFLELTKGNYMVLSAAGNAVSVYSTTYYDTADHHFYMLHHNGMRPRIKVRVRTYLDTATTFLEVKNKDNHDKTHKSRMRLISPADMDTDEDEVFLEDKADVKIGDIHPCLANSFHRLTLVDKNYTERLTIDFDVEFSNLETGLSRELGNLVIMELKRSSKSDSPALDALLRLRVKPQSFSKYCIGTYLTNPTIKHNRFKKKLVAIGRMQQRIAQP